MTTEDFGGRRSAETTVNNQPTIPTTQTAVQSHLPSLAEKERNRKAITPVTDDFLSGFNAGYTTGNSKPSTQTTNSSVWENDRKKPKLSTEQTLSQKGITPLHDDFLEGFYSDDLAYFKRSGPQTSKYTGDWEAVQPDTAGSGLQIHARAEEPVPQTEAEMQTAYEEAKAYYESIRNEMDRTANERGTNTAWYDALSREYGSAWEQYSTLKEQYMSQFPDNRVWGVISGSGMDYAGQMLSAAGTMAEGIAEYFPAYGPYQNEIVGFNPSAYIPERDTTLITKYVSDPLRKTGADLSEKGQNKVQEQKKGLGKFGQFAVDLGSAATQMVLDVGLGLVTGGNMAIPMLFRTYGDAAAEAEAAGADLNQQMLYATTSAAASYGIEQFCNVAFTGLKLIAPGVADDFVTDVVEKLALKAVGDPVGAQALTNIGMLIASGAGEGVEETLESLLNPFLQQMSYDKDAQTVLQNPELLADAAYEGWIGAILGVFGRGTNSAIDLVDNLVHNKIMPGEKLMEAAGVGEPEVLGAVVMNEMDKMDGTEQDGSNNVGTSLDTVESLDDFVATPQKLTGITGQELHNYLVASGYDVQPLSRGSFKGIPYEDGGGFKVNWGGDRILQYHPAKSSHHGGAYFKISSGETGTIRIDMDGNIIK